MYGYYCPICNKTHQMDSGIGKEHLPAHIKWREVEDAAADERRKHEKLPTQEEASRILYKNIFGQ